MTISLREANKRPDYLKRELESMAPDDRVDICEGGFIISVVTVRELLQMFADDSGSLTLPYALVGLAAYMVYWMISHGVFQALTALQAVR